jgi:hypothetical protein
MAANAQATARPNAAKYIGPQCFATLMPQVVESLGRVTSGREPSMQIFSSGDTVFVEPGGTGVRAGETYILYRIDGDVRHPSTDVVLGRAVNLLGQIEIIQVDDGRALGRITNTCGEIEPGDHLHPLLPDAVIGDVHYPPLATDYLLTPRESDATVVHGYSESLREQPSNERQALGNVETYAAGDVVTIDQGTAHGWAADMRVMLYTTTPEVAAADDKLGMEPVVQGQGVVIYALDQTCVVMITDGGGAVRRGSRARSLPQ